MPLTICHIPTPPTTQDVAPLLPLLPEWRREQALRFRHPFGQYACAQTWLMLCQLLARHTDLPFSELRRWTIAYNPYGKPFFPDHPDCLFSISHCRTALAVALDNSPVGIDIEHIRHADLPLIQRTMNTAEQALIADAPAPDRAFTALWTQKEAVLKLRGTGIIEDLHHVLTDSNGISINTHGFTIETHETDSYIYSLARTETDH